MNNKEIIENFERDLIFKYGRWFDDSSIKVNLDLDKMQFDEDINDYIKSIELVTYSTRPLGSEINKISSKEIVTTLRPIFEKYGIKPSSIFIKAEEKEEAIARTMQNKLNQSLLNDYKGKDVIQVVINDKDIKVLVKEPFTKSSYYKKALEKVIEKVKDSNIEINNIGVYQYDFKQFDESFNNYNKERMTDYKGQVFNQIEVYKLGIDFNMHKTYTSAFIYDKEELESKVDRELKFRSDENSMEKWKEKLTKRASKETKVKSEKNNYMK